MRVLSSGLLTFCLLVVFGIPALADIAQAKDNIEGLYEIEELTEGIKVYADRDHILKEVPEKYANGNYTYIRCSVRSVREVPDVDITFDLSVSCRVYVLWIREAHDWKVDPTDWLKKDYQLVGGETFVWGPAEGASYDFEVWKSKTVFPPGEFHTYTSGNDSAYVIFVTAEAHAIESFGKLSTTWARIRSLY